MCLPLRGYDTARGHADNPDSAPQPILSTFDPAKTTIAIVGVEVSRAGEGTGKAAERRASKIMRGDAFEMTMTLAAGRRDATIRTCDLGVDYVRFNSDYSS